jgi:hypothetical protein
VRALFSTFDHFMCMFVAWAGVLAGSLFMPLVGGPMQPYEARALGAGWDSLRTGQAASIADALEIAASLPAEVVFPSAHAHDLSTHALVAVAAQAPPSAAEVVDETGLLGGPLLETPQPRLQLAQQNRTAPSRAALAPPPMTPAAHSEVTCAAPKVATCESSAAMPS